MMTDADRAELQRLQAAVLRTRAEAVNAERARNNFLRRLRQHGIGAAELARVLDVNRVTVQRIFTPPR